MPFCASKIGEWPVYWASIAQVLHCTYIVLASVSPRKLFISLCSALLAQMVLWVIIVLAQVSGSDGDIGL